MKKNFDCAETIFVGDSEMATLMRSLDWSQTLLGPVSDWASSLKTAVSICLNSRFPMVIWWGKDLVLLYNDAWRPILGTKHPKALGRPGQEVWSEVWDIIGVQLRSVLETAQATWSDDMLIPGDRYGYIEESYFTYSYSPIFLESGAVGGAFTAVTETTRRVIGERRLSTLRELAANSVEAKSVAEACQIASNTLANNPYDIPFALLYLVEQNGEQARLIETVRLEAGTPASPVLVNLSQQEGCWNLAQVMRTGQAETINRLIAQFGRLPGGAWEEPSRSATVLPVTQSGQKKQLAGFLVLGISPHREFDDEYRGFFDLVASNVATGIANAQTYEAERNRAEALAELDRAKTAFFSNVSHEFRTPLTLMMNPLQELSNTLDGRLQPDEREQLHLIQRNGLRLQKLVNTLLDFSRIEAGRIQASYEPIDLAAYTAELASVFRSLIERAGMRLVIDCPPLPEPVYVDREMWEKIVLNLMSNAFKFTFAGSITVRLQPVDNSVELSVTDTGVGIPEAELPRLFERFHRVSGTRSRTYEGSGIGLALVQDLVKLHGGTLRVTSQLEQGTTFTIALPFGSTHLPSDLIQATRTLTSTALGADPYVVEASRWLPEEGNEEWRMGHEELGASIPANSSVLIPNSQFPRSARILLVEDNADMRAYIKRLLSQYWDVQSVSDGLAALEVIAQQIPDLVLSDVMMPGLDGFGLLRQLRSNPRTREIPIVLLSARAGEESRIEGLEAGADDYLTKPFSARELLARVEATLKLAQLRRDATQREQALRQEAESAKQTVETILSSIRDGFYQLDRDWRYTYVNDRYCDMAEIQREVILGQTVWELFPDTIGTDFHLWLQQAATEQTPIQFEYFYASWNRWYEHRVYPSFDGMTVFIAEITARKQAEAALRHSEERYRCLVEVAPQLVWVTDAQGRNSYVSQQMCDYMGLPFERLMNLNWQTAIHPDDVEHVFARWMEAVNLGTLYEAEYRLRKADGSYHWHLGRAMPFRDERGQITEWFGVCTNISDRKQAEEELRESERRFRRLVESNMFGVAFGDFTGGIHYVNDYFLNMVGYTREELEAEQVQWIDITPPEYLPLDQQAMVELRTQGIATPFEKEYIRKDGSRVPILIGSAMLDEPYDEQQEIIAFYVDLTERKQTENALRQALQKLNFHVENTPMAVIEWDGELRVTRWSGAAERIFGWQADEVLGRLLPDLHIVFEDDIEQVAETSRRLTSGGEPYVFSYNRNYTKRGDVIHCECYNSSLRDESGRMVSVLSLVLDVTDKKRAEVEREQLLAREQAARETAEAANRIKDEFLAVLSHELRSPLNPILGWSKLLLNGKLDEARTKQALTTIERNAKLQSELIEDLLDVSRILRGKLSLTVSPVNLASTIQAAIETVQLAAEAKSIGIETRLDPQVGLIAGEPTRLQQVVWNLLTNAVKFTPSGGQVTVQLEQIDRQAQITVTDTGKGITADFLPHVFDYFRQADSATTRKFGGLGLGLAIVRHLVELHGGSIRADSPGEGLGATFTVSLPLMRTQSTVEQSPQSSEQLLDLQGIKVLVVDDDTDTRDFTEFLLAQSGAEVIAVASAREALTALMRSKPNVLLSDIGMPDMDGYMLMQQVRALPPEQGGEIPAIALTAYAGEFDQRQALSVGFQRHVPKPVEPETLVRAIVSLLRQVALT